MTNVQAGAYSDFFEAASVYSGVPNGDAGPAGMGQLVRQPAADQDDDAVARTGVLLKQQFDVLKRTKHAYKTNAPQSGYTQTIYSDRMTGTAQLVGYSAVGVGHTVSQHPDKDIVFFGIT
ncbi:Uu.00g095230.m01.CDS01 [Anthostomella pinea]|uniref:Uu.00g095230.m01.CDS01 n=1 Tax=Anthostomella pinea TaxID=933095 RepID=A0AAI8VT38_9PEZI|nr:Uu.00g095230.m01.CDS01 [Anthostomella pinea]